MLEYSKKVYDSMLSEFVNLKQYYLQEGFSTEQRASFIGNSIQQLQTYCIQLFTVIECLANSRQSSTDIHQATSLIIPIDYKLQYTGSKVGLTELGYAFTAMGLFNNGQAGVGMVIQYLEKVFFTDLGNYTATFQDILNRKTGNTKFIDSLKSSLEGWIDRLD
jgi:hypothetical protein